MGFDQKRPPPVQIDHITEFHLHSKRPHRWQGSGQRLAGDGEKGCRFLDESTG